MRRARALAAELMDSPCLNWDLMTMFSAWRLGAWFLLLNLFLGASMAFVLLLVNESGGTAMVGMLGLGQMVAIMLFVALSFFLTVFVPIRASGLMDGPRWARYFDQIVLSGISPARYVAGKILAMNAFCLLVLAVTLPYMIFALSLGGVRPLYLITSVAALFVYANLLTLFTLTGATFISELFVVPAVIFASFVLLWIGLTPLPPVVGILVPSHYFITPLFAAAEKLSATAIPVTVFGLQLPLGSAFFFFLGSGVALTILGTLLLVGPVHCIGQPNSTFGEVVMPGDVKRKSIFRRRLDLRRRSELCFFYENRSDWLLRRELPLRWGALIGFLVLIAASALGALHLGSTNFNRDDIIIISMSMLVVFTLIATVAFSNDKSTERTEVRWGSRRFQAGTVNAVAFTVLFLLVSSVAVGLPQLREWISDLNGSSWVISYVKPDDSQEFLSFLFTLPLVWLVGFGFYASFRLACSYLWNFTQGFVLAAIFYLLILCTGPLVLGTVLAEYPNDFPAAETVRIVGGFISYLSPYTAILLGMDANMSEEVDAVMPIGIVLTLLVHVPVTAILCLAAIRRHFKVDPWKCT